MQNLSALGEIANDPEVAVDATGAAVFAWQLFDGYRIQTRTRTAAGVLGAIATPSSVQSFFPPPPEGQIAIDPGGDAIVTWENHVSQGVDAVAGP